ncbi:MAG: stage III sporulation AC/AD family protein [Romboutsia sp.]
MSTEIALILKVAGIGLLILVVNMILDTAGKGDWKMYPAIIGSIVAFTIVLDKLDMLFKTMRTMFQLY